MSARAIAFVCALPDRPLLDRIVRGRAWIPLLGLMLAGIVAMQVEVLKLGASIGRSIERGSALQTRNETLRATVGALDDDQRVEAVAAKSGMVMPPPQTVGFLSAGSGEQVQRAVASIHAPDPAAFLAATSANGSVIGAPGSADAAAGPSSAATSAGVGAGTAQALGAGAAGAAGVTSTAAGPGTLGGSSVTSTAAGAGTPVATGTAIGNSAAATTPASPATGSPAATTPTSTATTGPAATTASPTGG